MDSGVLGARVGTPLELRGTIATAPRTSADATRFALETPEGRIAVEVASTPKAGIPAHGAAFPALDEIDEGREVTVTGTVREPSPWEHSLVQRLGASRVLAADSLEATGEARGGFRGALDDVRRRAEAALERGTAPVSAALLRGFVLGQDDRIPEPVREDFRRSGLAHILAVSGQNVMLLAILATPLLALAGVPLRSRLVAIARDHRDLRTRGGCWSIDPACGCDGRGRHRRRACQPAERALVRPGLRRCRDAGHRPSRNGRHRLAAQLRRGLRPPRPRAAAHPHPLPTRDSVRRALAEGAAMTLAASLATAPIAAHHFGTVSAYRGPGQLARAPRGRARDVARNALRGVRPDSRRAGRDAYLARRALRRVHRLGRARARAGVGATRRP